ncbi:hypothetical protein ACT7DN_07535 [Bacillus paranthracis]
MLVSINVDFGNCDKNDVKFWRFVGVSIDLINELSPSQIEIRFKSMLNNVTLNELAELAMLLNVDIKDVNKKEQVECFNEVPIDSQKRDYYIKRIFESKEKKRLLDIIILYQ